ncbi:MAG TPA: hypothetical protein VE396_04440 [Xanthobacteraceae bacterium]|jgi:hypothetical protein|nr:hypothetical protein [Xanthobacteraceae bacterium]
MPLRNSISWRVTDLYDGFVTSALNDAAMMHGDGWIDQVTAERAHRDASRCLLLTDTVEKGLVIIRTA